MLRALTLRASLHASGHTLASVVKQTLFLNIYASATLKVYRGGGAFKQVETIGKQLARR